MGTSSSSNGPGSGVPMVPSWADDPPGNNGDGDKPDDIDGNPKAPPPPSPIAPERRFATARRSIGSFARNGNQSDMRRGVGQYISNGYGGSNTATRRFSRTANTASTLAGVLSSVARAAPGGASIDVARLQGRSADEVMDAIVDAVSPIDGSQDAEAARESVKEALCDLLNQQPDVDLLELDAAARDIVIEGFVAADVYRRIFLDIGKHIQDSAPSAAIGLQRLRQVKDYVRQTVKSAFQKIKGSTLDKKNIAKISIQSLNEAFQVFEGYAE